MALHGLYWVSVALLGFSCAALERFKWKSSLHTLVLGVHNFTDESVWFTGVLIIIMMVDTIHP
jgi:hypothetical protein